MNAPILGAVFQLSTTSPDRRSTWTPISSIQLTPWSSASSAPSTSRITQPTASSTFARRDGEPFVAGNGIDLVPRALDVFGSDFHACFVPEMANAHHAEAASLDRIFGDLDLAERFERHGCAVRDAR
jgi:hypothetical protein